MKVELLTRRNSSQLDGDPTQVTQDFIPIVKAALGYGI